MEKRIFVAIGLSIAFLWLWAAIAPRLFPELNRPAPKPAAASKKDVVTSSTPVAAPGPADAGPASEPRLEQAPVVPAIAATATQFATVDTPDFTARFSNRGAQLVSYQLKHHKTKSGELVDLVKSRPATRTDFPFA